MKREEEEVENKNKNGNCDKSDEQIFREVEFLRFKQKYNKFVIVKRNYRR